MEANKVELDAVKRAEQQQAATVKEIVSNVAQVGKIIGSTDNKIHAMQEAAEKQIVELLDASRKLGLNAKMLSGRGKTKGVAYLAFVAALEKTGKQVSDATRDNYMSKIRVYIENQGSKPLDLYGNIYTMQREQQKLLEAQKTAAELAALKEQQAASTPGEVAGKRNDSSKKPGPVAITTVPSVETKTQKLPPVIESSYKGALPLIQFGRAWIEENKGCMALEKLCSMLADVVKQAEVLMPKK